MTENIAIFDNEEGVLDAIRLLREAGAEPDDIRVIVNNREGAPRISSDGDIRIEELYELQITRSEEADKSTFLPLAQTTAFPLGASATGPGPVGVVLAGGFEGDVPGSAELLREMGIPDDAANRCAKAIENGAYVLVADTEAGINAESLLGRAGAASVIGRSEA
ncbi:hypothetical protein [Cohnella sp. GCM10027633]|uniref:hypothetical protein n=1 Tax=unclassified Cohnella TaxID=2636738 RepID=UPI0036398C8D